MKRKLLTIEGYDKLKEELSYLVRKKRPETTEIVSWAASLGDRSENADYHANKRLLRKIDGRIHRLIKLFEIAEKIEYSPVQEGTVFFGAWIELENDNGDKLRLRIVGDEEVYWRNDYISIHSPMAKAILRKKTGDEAHVNSPSGVQTWYIINIEYNTDLIAPEDTL